MPDDPFAFAQAQSFNSYLCSTVHVNHAHKRRGYRWAVDETSFADMKRKVPETDGRLLCPDRARHDQGPVGNGRALHGRDPYLYTIALWLEGDGVDLAAAAESGGSPQADVGAARGAEGTRQAKA